MNVRLAVVFYATSEGREPVRDWLKRLNQEDKRRIGEDILTVQRGWPVGMPTCKPLKDGILEVRTPLANGRTSRVLFFINSGTMYLLHGFIKKTRKTPKQDIELALDRKKDILGDLQSNS